MTTSISITKEQHSYYPLITSKRRLSIWEKARGLWKTKKPDPIKTFEKIRNEWERNP